MADPALEVIRSGPKSINFRNEFCWQIHHRRMSDPALEVIRSGPKLESFLNELCCQNSPQTVFPFITKETPMNLEIAAVR